MLSRIYLPSTRIEHEELDGLLNILGRVIAEHGESGEYDTAYYVGAQIALQIIRYHERIDTPDDFMLVFDNYLNKTKEG